MLKSVVALSVLVFSIASFGATIYMQDLGADFVPQAGNPQGDIVGYKLSTNQAAVRRANGTIEDLGTLGGSQSRATAISDDGSIIVGWAQIASGTQKAFRHESSTMIQVTTALGANQAVGLDSDNNVYFNRLGATDSVNRWIRSSNTDQQLVNNAQTSGVNLDGTFMVKASSGTPSYNDGTPHTIVPTTYFGSAGVSDSDLSAGSLSGSAAYYRLGDPFALNIPNILTLGATSFATGVNDFDRIVGDTDSTVFLYSLFDNTLTDLNAADFQGANTLLIDDIYGIADNNIFFGKYTDLDNQTRYFRGSLDAVIVPEPSALDLLGVGIVKVIVFGDNQDEKEDEKEE